MVWVVPAVSTAVGIPVITPVALLTERPAGSDDAHTSTSVCPSKVGVIVTDSPCVATNEVTP